MLRVLAIIMVLGAGALWAGAGRADPLREVWHDEEKAGPVTLWSLRVLAYAPPSLTPPSAPAVVLMHGCLQGPRETFDHTGWREVADRRGLLLVVVDFDDVGENCLWWFEPEQRRPATARQGEAIVRGLAEARRAFNVPEGENFATGLSAGAAMTVVLLALYPDTFAAGGAIAGTAFDCPDMTDKTRLTWRGQPCVVPGMQQLSHACACMAGDVDRTPEDWAQAVRVLHPERQSWPRLSVWQGTTDPVVVCRNAVETAEQWSALHGGGAPDLNCPEGKGEFIATRNPAGDRVWRLPAPDGRPAVELRLLDGFTHAQPIANGQNCGSTGKGFAEAGVCAASELADFFLGRAQ